MRVFAIGDLHLPGGGGKAMDVFGPHWERHFERIGADWRARVATEDVVVIPGDISWALHLQDAAADLQAIGELPGRKILLRGNHDYWWSAIGRVRAVLPAGMYALQNDALVLDEQVFCGTRGWVCPADAPADKENAGIWARELLRMEMSLKAARRIAPELPMTVAMHFPPWGERSGQQGQLSGRVAPSPFLRLAEDYGATRLVYGHLHGASLRYALSGRVGGLYIHQVSCDGLGFRLLDVEQAEQTEEVD
jgi:predicted phosphohydrolase